MNNKSQLITHDELISLGFEYSPTLLIKSYELDISHFEGQYKKLIVCLNPGNIYSYLREMNKHHPDNRFEDCLICIFDGDINGILTYDWVRTLISLLKSKK